MWYLFSSLLLLLSFPFIHAAPIANSITSSHPPVHVHLHTGILDVTRHIHTTYDDNTSTYDIAQTSSSTSFLLILKSPVTHTRLDHLRHSLNISTCHPYGYHILSYLPHHTILIIPQCLYHINTTLHDTSTTTSTSTSTSTLTSCNGPSWELQRICLMSLPHVITILPWENKNKIAIHALQDDITSQDDISSHNRTWIHYWLQLSHPLHLIIHHNITSHIVSQLLMNDMMNMLNQHNLSIPNSIRIRHVAPTLFLLSLHTHHITHTHACLHLLSSRPEISWIEERTTFHTMNNEATSLIQSGMNGYDIQDIKERHPIWKNGVTGAGQVIAMGDTGIAYHHCLLSDPDHDVIPDVVNFEHRKVVLYAPIRGKTYDQKNGHGTFCAASIAGHLYDTDPTTSTSTYDIGRYAGVAYDAKLAVFDLNDGKTFGKIKPPPDIYHNYYGRAYSKTRARIMSNSWGSKHGRYILESAETDRFVFDYPDLLPIFAAGNYGQSGFFSVVAPGTSKNALQVGSSKNQHMKHDISSTNPTCPLNSIHPPSRLHDLSRFSGRGPTYDLRVKPDVIIPGEYIISARSDGRNTSTPTAQCSACNTALKTLMGTSMATALAAGTASLVRQYYQDGFYPSGHRNPAHAINPSAALVKGTLIHSAIQDVSDPVLAPSRTVMNVNVPWQQTVHQPWLKSGFGRVQLDHVLRFGDNATRDLLYIVDHRKIHAEQIHSYCFKALPNILSTGFRATLVWPDPPASLSSSYLLINNLDLHVINTDKGTSIVGNQHLWEPELVGLIPPRWDTTNNVEQVSVTAKSNSMFQMAPNSHLLIQIRATSLPVSIQPYALLISGALQSTSTHNCTHDSICPMSCHITSGKGKCGDDGICKCEKNYTGADCSIGSDPLDATSCISRTSEVLFGDWTYYHVDIDEEMASTMPILKIMMQRITGDPDLFVSFDAYPTLTRYGHADTNTGLNHQVITPTRVGRFFIGVHGYLPGISQFHIMSCAEVDTEVDETGSYSDMTHLEDDSATLYRSRFRDTSIDGPYTFPQS